MPHSLSVIRLPVRSEINGSLESTWITGGYAPSAVTYSSGLTWISPSCNFQYVHIGQSLTVSPLGLQMSMVLGKPSIVHRPLIHGPAPTTTFSAAIVPWSVRTAVTAPSFRSKPVTSTPERMVTPSASTFATSPITDEILNAKPPCF